MLRNTRRFFDLVEIMMDSFTVIFVISKQVFFILNSMSTTMVVLILSTTIVLVGS